MVMMMMMMMMVRDVFLLVEVMWHDLVWVWCSECGVGFVKCC
jgi:hypothetical protein